MGPEESIEHHFERVDKTLAELCMAGVTVGDDKVISSIQLLLLPKTWDDAVTALSMGGREDLTYDQVKSKLRSHNLKLKSTSGTEMALAGQENSSNAGTSNDQNCGAPKGQQAHQNFRLIYCNKSKTPMSTDDFGI